MEVKAKIIFLGTPQFAADILEGILGKIPIHSVVTQPDKPQGRKSELIASEVKKLAQKKKLPVFQPQNKTELTEYIKNESPELVILAAFGMILPEDLLRAPVFGCLNVHPSLLPKYRGPAPIEAAILNGDLETGVTIMEINEKMDEGNIIAQKEINLSGEETAPELEEFCAAVGADMLVDIVPRWLAHELVSVPQTGAPSYTKLIRKDDGKIAFGFETAEQIERKCRAYAPWPGVFAYWEGKKLDFYKIKTTDKKIKSGEVSAKDGQLLIGTTTTAITADFIKLEGKNKISAKEFLKGYPKIIGETLN